MGSAVITAYTISLSSKYTERNLHGMPGFKCLGLLVTCLGLETPTDRIEGTLPSLTEHSIAPHVELAPFYTYIKKKKKKDQLMYLQLKN